MEIYDDNLEFVKKQDTNKIWTLINGNDQTVIVPGFHLVNRINYVVTEKRWESENIEVKYCDED